MNSFALNIYQQKKLAFFEIMDWRNAYELISNHFVNKSKFHNFYFPRCTHRCRCRLVHCILPFQSMGGFCRLQFLQFRIYHTISYNSIRHLISSLSTFVKFFSRLYCMQLLKKSLSSRPSAMQKNTFWTIWEQSHVWNKFKLHHRWHTVRTFKATCLILSVHRNFLIIS